MSSNDDSRRRLLFETYKLHAELAEQIASLRESLNKLYSGMVVSIVAASVIIHRLVPKTEMVWVLPTLGIVVSLSWILSLYSVTGRLSAKHKVLVALEEAELPFDFLNQENEEFDKCCFVRRKWTGQVMPWLFLSLCLAWLVCSFIGCDGEGDGSSCAAVPLCIPNAQQHVPMRATP